MDQETKTRGFHKQTLKSSAFFGCRQSEEKRNEISDGNSKGECERFGELMESNVLEMLPVLQNQASSSTDSSWAEKSKYLGALKCSYRLSLTNTDSMLFQSMFMGSISCKKHKRTQR